jgi:hypothetical protein
MYQALSHKELFAQPAAQKDYEEDDDETSHAKVIERQQAELKRLEEEENQKVMKQKHDEEMRKKKEKEELIKKEKDRQQELNKHHMKLFMKQSLPVEPLATDPASTLIVFRLPSGHKAERRFNKKDSIDDLYNYISSLEEEHLTKFDLIQTFPFVIFVDRQKTLEEEKLFPNAVLQVREL